MKILKIKIARGRARLQALWNAKGCTDAEVLKAGDELDLLLNKYQRLLDERKRIQRISVFLVIRFTPKKCQSASPGK